MFAHLVAYIETLSQTVPLELFVVVGTILEEIISPIPSPLVMTLAGSIAVTQEYSWGYLFFLALLAAASKTAGATLFYVLSDKAEDILIPRFGKFFGVSHADLEHYGERFQKNWKDEVMLTLLRSIPMMPSIPISVACGVLKIKFRTFLTSTFIGFYVRELFFLGLGFTGLHAAESLMNGIDSIETLLKVIIVVGALLLLAWLYYKRSTGHPANWFRRKK
jgi:membrane protein DedA with SNARE-associated domain